MCIESAIIDCNYADNLTKQRTIFRFVEIRGGNQQNKRHFHIAAHEL